MRFPLACSLLLVGVFASVAKAQNCPPPGALFLTTQSQIDLFSTNYPGCTEIPADVDLFVRGTDSITNLDGLGSITSIQGELFIEDNNLLTSIAGIRSVTAVGGRLWFSNNDAVSDLSPLSDLLVGGDFRISEYSLPESNLNIRNLTIGGNFEVVNNPNFADLGNMSNVAVGGLLRLVNLSGLTTLSGISAIEVAGGYDITSNPQLVDISELDPPDIIRIDLTIQGNAALQNLDAFGNVTAIEGRLLINFNESLSNIDGLSNVQSVGEAFAEGLSINFNPQLNECCSFCPLLTADGTNATVILGPVIIGNNGPECSTVADITGCAPCGDKIGVSYCMALPNSTGKGASLRVLGSESVSTNRFTLQSSPVPPATPGLFFYGPSAISTPFGDGLRCVGGPLFRLPPLSASFGGVLAYSYDLSSPVQSDGQIFAGSTWRFQAWYRDTAAMQSGFNTSDGLEVTFQL